MSRLRVAAQVFGLLPGSTTNAAGGGGLAGLERLASARACSSGAGAAASSSAARLVPGAAFTFTRLFTPAEVGSYALLTGDSNPIHVDSSAAQQQGLPAPVLPGMLVASLFPAIIGSNFPGAIYLSQTLKFKHFAVVGESLTATLTVDKSSGSRVSFQTVCRQTGSGLVVVEGTALALIKQHTS